MYIKKKLFLFCKFKGPIALNDCVTTGESMFLSPIDACRDRVNALVLQSNEKGQKGEQNFKFFLLRLCIADCVTQW